MSVLSKLMAFWSSKAGNGRGKQLYIIDAAHLSGSGRGQGRLSPREQIQILHKLSRFAEQEGINVQAVFEGKSLREVANGEKFREVTVFFTENSTEIPELLIDLSRRARGRSAVVVTSNTEVEKKVIALGGSAIRSTTFRKGMEGGGGGGGDGGNSRGGFPPRHRQRQRPRGGRRHDRRPDQQQQQSSQPDNSGSEQDSPPPSDDPVRNLIDLVE